MQGKKQKTFKGGTRLLSLFFPLYTDFDIVKKNKALDELCSNFEGFLLLLEKDIVFSTTRHFFLINNDFFQKLLANNNYLLMIYCYV